MLPSAPTPHSQPGCAFVFNGDADGLVSQHILELTGVTPTLRITGVKRDISLLGQLPGSFHGDLHVFDIAYGPNAEAAEAFLDRNLGQITWYDHHESGPLPVAPHFKPHIHAVKGQCTALIVNACVDHQFSLWAAVAAFGDNVESSADAILRAAHLDTTEVDKLKQLGILLNYNAYGEAKDVFCLPLHIAEQMENFENPFEFFHQDLFLGLAKQMHSDAIHFANLPVWKKNEHAYVFRIPNTPWARRYGATWANTWVREHTEKAVAVFTELDQDIWQASLRTARLGPASEFNAGHFAQRYPSGGGRPQAGGINALSENELEACADAFLKLASKQGLGGELIERANT